MENGEDDSANKPMSAFDAMRKRFEQQEQNNAKPTVTPKPLKLGGGNELNIFATKKAEDSEQKPGINKPGSIGKIKPEPVTPRENSPSNSVGHLKKRNSNVSIPAAFLQNADSPAPPLKPKPKVEPKSKSDANNNPDQDNCVSPMSDHKPKISAMKPEKKTKPSVSGNISPRDGAKISPRGGQVSLVANAIQGLSPGDLKRNLKPVKKDTDKPTDTPKPVEINIQDKDKPYTSAVELRKKFESLESKKFSAQRRSVKSVIRIGDNKKFRKNEDSFKNSGEAPVKPEKLDVELDIEHLIEEFKNHVKSHDSGESGVTELEEEEEYDDVANYKRPISLIKPLTEEDEDEEEGWKQMGLGESIKEEEEFPPPPDEFYDDGITPVTQNEEEGDELYEYLSDEDKSEPSPPLAPKTQSTSSEPPAVPDLKTNRKTSETDSHKESKESEKERKKREKEERERKEKEEKAQKKKEKELKAFLSSYQISAEDLMKSEGKGKVKKNAKASNKKCLAVQEGDKLDIIRMQNKGAKGKWLVRIDTTEKVGYVEADNIEVDTADIRSLMENKKDSTANPADEDDQEMYEAVDGEDGVNGYEQDEIYEECN